MAFCFDCKLTPKMCVLQKEPLEEQSLSKSNCLTESFIPVSVK